VLRGHLLLMREQIVQLLPQVQVGDVIVLQLVQPEQMLQYVAVCRRQTQRTKDTNTYATNQKVGEARAWAGGACVPRRTAAADAG
jgi:hypothetical protein